MSYVRCVKKKISQNDNTFQLVIAILVNLHTTVAGIFSNKDNETIILVKITVEKIVDLIVFEGVVFFLLNLAENALQKPSARIVL